MVQSSGLCMSWLIDFATNRTPVLMASSIQVESDDDEEAGVEVIAEDEDEDGDTSRLEDVQTSQVEDELKRLKQKRLLR